MRAIAFIHGVGGGAALFAPVADRMAVRRPAFAFSLPGHDGTPIAGPAAIATIATALEAELDRRGVTQVDLVGHSLGGMAALEFVVTRPDRVASAVLVTTTPFFGSKDGAFERKFLKSRFGPLDAGRGMKAISVAQAGSTLVPSTSPARRTTAIRTFAAIPEAAYRFSLNAMVGFDRRSALLDIACPVLCLAGAHDLNAPPRSLQRMASAIPGARFAVIAGAGHFPHLERPEAFALAIEAFLFGDV